MTPIVDPPEPRALRAAIEIRRTMPPGGMGDAGAQILVGVPAEVDQFQAEVARLVDAVEDSQTGVDDFGTDPVAGNHSNLLRHSGGGL
jgi:hypothetical protein